MRDIVERRIPVLAVDSKIDGPTVWLTACLHGDEVGGTAIVHDVFAAVGKYGLRRGRLQALPLVNSLGFENMSRFVNADREDLNRCFPGNASGSAGEQIAHRIFDLISASRPGLVIDLHNDWIHSVPYVLIEPAPIYASAGVRKATLKLALGTRQLVVQEPDDDVPDGTLAGALVAAGIPAFTIEAGGAYGISEDGVRAGTAAILDVLRELDMVDPEAVAGRASPGDAVRLRYCNRPLSSTNGLVRFTVGPGDRVEAGQVVARIFSAFGSCEETLRAEAPGYVLGVADHARTVPGGEVIAFGEIL